MTQSGKISTTESAEQTERLAAGFADVIRPGDVILMTGEVGSGKSTFVRAALRSLGVTGAIPSPTFTLARRYEADSGPASHIDLYRIGPLSDEVPELLGEYLEPEGIVFVEWPGESGIEPGLLDSAARVGRVHLEHKGPVKRRITIDAPERV
jgi:tRNA threonylcarbamoyladenosine biosynthesis protein TsaE